MTDKIEMEPGVVYRLSTGVKFLVLSLASDSLNPISGRVLDLADSHGCGRLPEGATAVEILEDRRVQMGKKYTTRSGLPVRVLTTDLRGIYSVVVAIHGQAYDSVSTCYADGSQYCTRESELDLIEIPPLTFEPDEVVEVQILGCGAWEKAYYRKRHGATCHSVWGGGRSSRTARSDYDYDVFRDGNIRKLAE